MSLDNRYGMYREKTIRRYDYNSDFLLKYNKLWDRFGVTAAFGGSVLRNKYYSTTITASQLSSEGPGMYSFANAAVALDTSPYRSNRQTNSLYGFVNLSWDDTYFLDGPQRLVVDAGSLQLELFLPVGIGQYPARQGVQDQLPSCQHDQAARFVGTGG